MIYNVRSVGYIIDVLWLVFGWYWFVRAFGNKKSVGPKDRVMQILYRVLIVFLCMAFLKWPSGRMLILPYTRVTQVAGILLCAAGVFFAIWARRQLAGNWSAQVTLKENHELITTGPYKIVRHPIYTGLLLAGLGTVLALNPSLTYFGFVVIGLVASLVRVKAEEKLMLQQFPDTYPAYKARVPALVPWLF